MVILQSSVSRADGVGDYFAFFGQLYGWLTQALDAVRPLP